jgi:hypothetical protein
MEQNQAESAPPVFRLTSILQNDFDDWSLTTIPETLQKPHHSFLPLNAIDHTRKTGKNICPDKLRD